MESANNTSAGLYVWRFSHPRWWSGSLQAVNRPSLPRKHYGAAVLIFQWAGRRKSERSDLRRRSEHASINSRPATTLLCSKSEAGSIYCLSPPPKVRTERNLQNSRLNPDETSSLVDLERRIPAQCAFFTQLMRESRKPEDSLAERGEFEPPVPIVNSQGRQRYDLRPFKAARVRCVPGMQGWTARCFG
jgi:hypothetical protein